MSNVFTANPRTGQTIHFDMSLNAFIDAYEKGKIVRYENNRPVSTDKAIKKVYDGMLQEFTPLALGSIYVSPNGKGKMELIDGHSRIAALVKLKNTYNKEQRLGELDLFDAYTVGIEVCNQADAPLLFKYLNNQTIHDSSDKIGNPDILSGNLVEQIERKSKTLLSNKRKKAIFGLLFAYNKVLPDDHFSLRHLIQTRHESTKLHNLGKYNKTHGIKEKSLNDIVSALEKFVKVQEYVKNHFPEISDWTEKSNGVFYYLMLQFLSSHKFKTRQAASIAVWLNSVVDKEIKEAFTAFGSLNARSVNGEFVLSTKVKSL